MNELRKELDSMDKRRALFGLLFALDNRLQAAGNAFYEEITVKQFFLLACLSLFQKEPPTIGELSEVMSSSHQNVKQMINKLEKKGYLTTHYDKKDKRKLRVVSTEKLSKFGDQYRDKENDFLDRFFEDLSDEEITFTLQAISKIESNLTKIHKEFK